MASVPKDNRGWRILFVDSDGTRRTLRLGRLDRKAAESIRTQVENLLVAKTTGQPVRQETAAWLAGIGEKLRGRLARVGLAEAKPAITQGAFLTSWFGSKRLAGGKPSTLVALRLVIQDLRRLFGPRALDGIGYADAEAYIADMRRRGLKPATIHKRIQRARQIFKDALQRGLVARNPFGTLRVQGGNPAERRAYVPVGDALRVIEHCPNVWWRLLVALARFGGLRIPSEAFSLRWADVDWERGRLVVPSPKTEGQGKPHRVIPLFPLLRPYLEQAFDAADEGAEYVIPEEYRRRAQGPSGWRNANLRTTLAKVIRRAGVEPWPKLWHNLRASCESDLAQAFPLAVVTKWLGNTPSVAVRHYVDPTDAAYNQAASWVHATGWGTEQAIRSEKVAQNPAQQTAEMGGILRKLPTQPIPQFIDLQYFATQFCFTHPPKVAAVGLEPTTRGL